MIAPLDSTVAQVVFSARRLEKAVHDPGPWTMSWGPHTVAARRVLTDDGVIFAASFPEACYLAPVESPLVLMCAGEVLDVRPMAHPGDTGFDVDWAIRGRVLTPA